jgi:hypothetical protein
MLPLADRFPHRVGAPRRVRRHHGDCDMVGVGACVLFVCGYGGVWCLLCFYCILFHVRVAWPWADWYGVALEDWYRARWPRDVARPLIPPPPLDALGREPPFSSAPSPFFLPPSPPLFFCFPFPSFFPVPSLTPTSQLPTFLLSLSTLFPRTRSQHPLRTLFCRDAHRVPCGAYLGVFGWGVRSVLSVLLLWFLYFHTSASRKCDSLLIFWRVIIPASLRSFSVWREAGARRVGGVYSPTA